MNVLISGASTGIGEACARHLAGRGARVFAGVRDEASFRKLAGHSDLIKPVYLDVREDASVRAAVARVVEEAGQLDALVNNAGIAIGGPIELVEVEAWHAQFEVNLFGMVRLTREALPHLRESRGRIVNLSSIAGRVAFPFLGPYNASKFAVEAFGDVLRREMRPQGVHVALIEPGAISTPLWDKSIRDGLERVTRMDSPLAAVYGPAIRRFNAVLDQTIRRAAPVEVVVRAVDHALYAGRPRRRYPVGRGIRAMTWFHDRLPAWVFDRALS